MPKRQNDKITRFHALKRLFLTHKRWALALLFLLLIGTGATYVVILKDLPTPTRLAAYDIPQTTKIYDRHETLLYEIFADENRTLVKLDDIPVHLRQATIAIEDKDFYRHQGFSPIGGILRAAKEIAVSHKLQGGSTITQQLVKTALLTPERTITRKIKEILLAFWTERIYSKDQVLEMYFNHVPYGGTSYGIAAAAKTYFGKEVKDLTLAESALLAGLPAAPTRFSPFGASPELATARQHAVLARMVEDHYIRENQADEVKRQPIIYTRQRTDIKAPHFVMYVKEKLVEKYGERMVEQGGLHVTTTLDLPLQEAVEATVSAGVARLASYRVTNGATVITRPPTGEILAMVGSVDYFATPSGNFNVAIALRQPGSSIKPINYAIGLETHKVTPATMFLDTPTCFAVFGQPLYCPKNYDGKFHGPVQLRFALGNSYNIPAVKMLALNSVSTMVASASAMGITTFTDPSRFGLSLTLGGGEVRITEMAEAFGIFANSGVRKPLTTILAVRNRSGHVLEEFKDANFSSDIASLNYPSSILINGTRILSSEVAFLISHILLDNNARTSVFGPSSALVVPGKSISAKTGTTDDFKDNWTIGFTPNFLTAVWVGNNDNVPMRTSGAEGAAPIWNAIMRYILKNQPDLFPKQPEGIVGKHVCDVTGTLSPANPDGGPIGEDQGGCKTRFEFFQKDNLPPTGTGVRRERIRIDKGSGHQAKSDQNDNVEDQDKTVVGDAFNPTYCLDCNHDGETATLIDMSKWPNKKPEEKN